MNLATKLTWLRIILVPLVVVFYYISTTWSYILATVMFILAAVTDFFDGYIARKYNQVTNLGKFLDPIADKILVFVAFLIVLDKDAVLNTYHIMTIAMGIMVVREFVIAALRQIAAANGKVIAADKLGKYKTFSQDIAIPFMLMRPVLVEMWSGIDYVVFGWILISTILALVSGINYIVVNKEVFSSK